MMRYTNRSIQAISRAVRETRVTVSTARCFILKSSSCGLDFDDIFSCSIPCEQSLFDLPRSVGKRKRLCERLRYSLTCRSSEKMDESVKFWTRQTGFTLLRMINSSNCWLIPRPRYFVCSLGISSRCQPKVLSMLVGMTRSILSSSGKSWKLSARSSSQLSFEVDTNNLPWRDFL